MKKENKSKKIGNGFLDIRNEYKLKTTRQRKKQTICVIKNGHIRQKKVAIIK
jgi:hypothetical protein